MDNKDTLVLADGTEITLESSQGMGALCVCADSHAVAGILWDKLTGENLKEVCIRDAAGRITGRYKDMTLDHITGRDNADGTVQLALCLREKTYAELLEERVAELEAGQQTHSAAIGDLGQAVSDMEVIERGGNDMGEFYGRKIRSGEINPKTGKAWALEDVPAYWREKSEKWLRDEVEQDG